MRENQDFLGAMFSYTCIGKRVQQVHPLREIRGLVDALLASIFTEYKAVFVCCGRPSVPPEKPLKALLLQIQLPIRSEHQLIKSVNYNLFHPWLVGLNIDDRVWVYSTFSTNRERLFNEDLSRIFFECFKCCAQWGRLARNKRISIDGMLIEAWASHKILKRGDDCAQLAWAADRTRIMREPGCMHVHNGRNHPNTGCKWFRKHHKGASKWRKSSKPSRRVLISGNL